MMDYQDEIKFINEIPNGTMMITKISFWLQLISTQCLPGENFQKIDNVGKYAVKIEVKGQQFRVANVHFTCTALEVYKQMIE